MKLDIGEKITEVLEKLSEKIGTTTEEIFPWYVKQMKQEGIVYLAILLISLFLLLIIFTTSFGQAEYSSDWNRFSTMSLISAILLLFVIVEVVTKIEDLITKITNPEYHALQDIIEDIQRLIN